jgi:hypothetical protein
MVRTPAESLSDQHRALTYQSHPPIKHIPVEDPSLLLDSQREDTDTDKTKGEDDKDDP